MKVNVTKKHIEKGDKSSPRTCPIALACDAKKRGWRILGGLLGIETKDGEHIHLPVAAKKFINNFDAGKPVKPFSFTIRTLKK